MWADFISDFAEKGETNSHEEIGRRTFGSDDRYRRLRSRVVSAGYRCGRCYRT